jgi:sugar lactone lactonase YvrE
MNSPNDVVVKSDGTIWFSDPVFGILGSYEGNEAEPQLGQFVYRLEPESGRLTVVADDILGPNGLAFSPEGDAIGRIALPECCADLCFGGRAIRPSMEIARFRDDPDIARVAVTAWRQAAFGAVATRNLRADHLIGP